MPIFGSSSSKKEKQKEAGVSSSSGYPTQAPPPYNPGYGAGAYPTQPVAQATPQGYTQSAPPSYTQQQPAYQGQVQAGQYAAPGQQGAPNPSSYYTQGMPPAYAPVQQTVSVAGAYDAGARFDGVAQRNIPPPPPGVMPNAAQMAQAQGHHVVGTQQHAGWLEGGQGGGYTIW